MSCTKTVYQAPPNSGNVFLGRTIPSLLDEACDRAPNAQAFNQWSETEWQSLSNHTFRTTIEAITLGLVDLGLQKGDRVALLMNSDANFCIADFSCLLANLVDVPIDLTQTIEHIIFVLQHSEAKALMVSNLDLLVQVMPYFWEIPDLQQIIVVDAPPNWQQTRSQWLHANGAKEVEQQLGGTQIPETACLDVPMFLHPAHPDRSHATFPHCIQILLLDEVRAKGQSRFSSDRLQQLRAALAPEDLATIVYIPDEAGHLQGVMLTHENLSGNALASFSGISDLKQGAQEVVLSFLPLNHVLARTLLYGHINYGHSIYFSNPNRVVKHLKEVQPTVLVTVPLFLEKIYSKIVEVGTYRAPEIRQTNDIKEVPPAFVSSSYFLHFKLLKTIGYFPVSLFQSLKISFTHLIFQWALNLAQQYELGHLPQGLYALQLKLADRLVLSKWRSLFGQRLKYLISGGAALKAELANVFTAAGVPILQGYGLTQASAVVCCNRDVFNRAGTVGVPIAGVEVTIADDQEIWVRGPYVTPGYYKNSEATRELIDADGWLHTGDLGEFTEDGFLKITGLKKALFKLSTGKYIVPLPIEQRLMQSSLVKQAIAVGSERKFCAMLIVPDLEELHRHAQTVGFDGSDEALLKHPCTLSLYQALVNGANCHLPYWATVKQFRLINATFTIDNGLLAPTGQVNRTKVSEVFAKDIDALYEEPAKQKRKTVETQRVEEVEQAAPTECPAIPVASCPAFAQSLNSRIHRLMTFMICTGIALPSPVKGFPLG